MSDRSKRNKGTLDYRELNKGNWVYKEDQQENSPGSESSRSSSAPSSRGRVNNSQDLDSDSDVIQLLKSFKMNSDGTKPVDPAMKEDTAADFVAEADEKAEYDVSAEYAAVADEEEELEMLMEEFGDFLDENKMEFITMSAEDYDVYVNRMEEYRKLYKVLERKIKKKISLDSFRRRYEHALASAIDNIKRCIMEAKKRKARLRENMMNGELSELSARESERLSKNIQEKEAVKFLITEINRLILELKNEFSKADDVDDEELLRRKEDYPENTLQLDRLSTKIQQAHQIMPSDYSVKDVNDMMIEYKKLLDLKKSYDKNLEELIAERELLKEKAFQTSALDINLPKFQGYNSDMDIFTFQSEFEKLYLRITPKKLLPDLLKNKYLADPALALVKSQDDIDEIWCRLKKSYGDKKMMLQKKLSEVYAIGSLESFKDLERLKSGLTSIINSMNDLMKLAEKHEIESKLYNGDGLNIIYGMLGDSRLTRWLSSINDVELEDKELWKRLIKFLDKELNVTQTKALVQRSIPQPTNKPHQPSKVTKTANIADPPKKQNEKCHFCGGDDHVTTNGFRNQQLVQYFACEKFVKMPVNQRFQELRAKELCHQCLLPGAKQNEGKHKDGKCQDTYVCKHPAHEKFPRKKHVLVCAEHCDTDENKALFETYKTRFITNQKKPLADFTKSMRLSFHIYSNTKRNLLTAPEINGDEQEEHEAVYGIQVININGERYTVFYDSGCYGLVTKHGAIVRLGNLATLERRGPTDLGGVGDIKLTSPYGEYRIKIPMFNGDIASMSGVCLEQITHEMPIVPLNTQVKDDIESRYIACGGNVEDLPSLPKGVGGEVDIMIGAKYLRYSPKAIFQLPSGLTIYESKFINADGGGRGVICGPHPIFTKIMQGANTCFFTDQYKLYRMGYKVNPDLDHLAAVPCEDASDDDSVDHSQNHYTTSQQLQKFDEVEDAGSIITYRCVDCRGCKTCRNSEQIEVVSIREEIEQERLNESVTLNEETQRIEATLPCIENPVTKLAPNKDIAYKLYQRRVTALSKSEKDKDDVITAEKKLQNLGYVDYVKNLSPKLQKMLSESPVQNFLPWFPVWSSNSVTTSCRPVFHGSLATATGYSLNSILPKGINNLNVLVEIVIRWGMYLVAMHTDVKQLYNRIILKEEYWCFQRYIWEENLDPSKIPDEKVIKTAIYGIRSSGNQATLGLRMTADKSKDTHPKVHGIVHKDFYADDGMTGGQTESEAYSIADGVEEVLSKGGFNLKGFTFSGKPPNPELSKDGVSVSVAGMNWFPEEDELQLNIKPLEFARKRSRKKEPNEDGSRIPKVLTRRQCCSKVGEVFDLTGRVAPITASFKVDLHTISKLKWDDPIPNEYRSLWESNFEMMAELKNIRFQRAIIPVNAESLKINTIDTADASKDLACSAIYARFKLKNGKYSCQLVFARTKLLAEGTTQPRGELIAAVLNAHTGEVVRRAFGDYHEKAVKLTDSQIVLHWMNNIDLRLNIFVRNRVIECCRYMDPKLLKYVRSADMIADIGTRRCTDINDVGPGSVWQEGFPWMKDDESLFPTKDIHCIKLDCKEKQAVNDEMIALKKKVDEFQWPQKPTTEYVAYRCGGQIVPSDVGLRYKYSKYILDPNKHRYKTSIRIMAYVVLFVKKFIQIYSKKSCLRDQSYKSINFENLNLSDPTVILTEDDVKAGVRYFHQKATHEVRKFAKWEKVEPISTEKEGILFYTGRILPDQQMTQITPLSEVMKDLSTSTFFVPIIEKNSPLAYSIVNEVHWDDPVAKHSGVETVLRYTMKHGYIIEGRDLVKKVRQNCERCRYLAKRTIEICMGPVSQHNLTIAPPFFITQVDLCGPYKAYTPHNKRSTIKIYLAVFVCATTGTTSMKMMDDYCTISFIQAFIRLSCEVGYPKILLTDEGSQLLKACKTMEFDFRDVKQKLYTSHNVEFDVCPVGGHNMHGRVERKIKEIKASIEMSFTNQRLSVIEWETVAAEISNCINDLPIGYRNWSADLENLDLITPNRLRLGRNNDRSPVGPLLVTSNPEKFIQSNVAIFNAWYEHWLISCVPKLMHQPKWFRTDYDLKKGDLILFLKEEGKVVGSYQYGIIEDINSCKDGKVRSVTVRYRNQNESNSRTTERAARQLVMIHGVDELSIMEELGAIATYADMKCKIAHDS